jgi:redox-sensitive bicupin YhaK (pirin superfamily)
MIRIRRSDERGHFNHGWLDTHHTFSFAGYLDPQQMGFRDLRVINEDRVEPGAGFGRHPHNDMEIVTYVLDGALEHEDSMGNGTVIRPGELQRMSAGTGITHSEWNHSKSAPVHFFQIWIVPGERGIEPGYEQKVFPEEERRGRLRLLATQDGADGSLTIHQDVRLYGALLEGGESVTHTLAPDRHAWVQNVRGELRLNGEVLQAGDGAAVSDESALTIEAAAPTELLLFDLA